MTARAPSTPSPDPGLCGHLHGKQLIFRRALGWRGIGTRLHLRQLKKKLDASPTGQSNTCPQVGGMIPWARTAPGLEWPQHLPRYSPFLPSLADQALLQLDRFFFFKIYLFFKFFCLLPVLVAARGIFVEACRVFHCGMWASLWLWRAGFLFSSCGARVPERVGPVVCGKRSLVEACELSSCGLSCPAACGILFR